VGGGGGGGGPKVGGRGALGFHPVPPFLRLALPHLWAGLSNFGTNVVFIARPAQKFKKTIGQHNFFSTTPN
jgi:hypothetical protein